MAFKSNAVTVLSQTAPWLEQARNSYVQSSLIGANHGLSRLLGLARTAKVIITRHGKFAVILSRFENKGWFHEPLTDESRFSKEYSWSIFNQWRSRQTICDPIFDF